MGKFEIQQTRDAMHLMKNAAGNSIRNKDTVGRVRPIGTACSLQCAT